ncbi:MAG: RsmE family RNA methyltransferase [Planctomycetaceae bacterium]
MTRRFHVPQLSTQPVVRLTGPEARHLAVVLRAGPGTQVELFDGQGQRALASVCAVGADWVDCEILTREAESAGGNGREVTLATAVPKGERFDWLIEKATELGVTRVIPLVTARSVVTPGDTKLERLRKTIVEASKQCGRDRLLELTDVCCWREFLAQWPTGDADLGQPSGHSTPPASLGTLWVAQPGGPRWGHAPLPAGPVTFVIGPEGGLTDAAVEQLRRLGAGLVGLGGTILRVETAALALATLARCGGEGPVDLA